MADLVSPEAKECPDCGELKFAAEFGRNKREKDGLARYCKSCFRARSKASYRKRVAAQGREIREPREVPGGFKYCPRCVLVKSVSDFGRNRSSGDGLTNYCKPCHNAVMAENRRRNHGSTRNYHLKRRYGVTADEIEVLRVRQGGICVICLRQPPSYVDHNHVTGLFRGLLCFGCNGGLGQFADDPYRLRQAAGHLDGEISHTRVMELEFGSPTIDGFAQRRVNRERRTRSDQRGTARHYRLTKRYGLGDADVRRIVDVQRGLCPICCDARGEHVDHCHRTGAVRGILCPACNTGMGQFRDDPVTLRRAADYLTGDLVRQQVEADGRTRLSFTIPDVDPMSVPAAGWRPYRVADGRERKAFLDMSERLERFRGLRLVVDEAYPHHVASSR